MHNAARRGGSAAREIAALEQMPRHQPGVGGAESDHATEVRIVLPFGFVAMVTSFVSLPVCYGSNVVNAVPGTELPINPHLQAVLMRGFALVAVHALWRDRRSHDNSLPI